MMITMRVCILEVCLLVFMIVDEVGIAKSIFGFKKIYRQDSKYCIKIPFRSPREQV